MDATAGAYGRLVLAVVAGGGVLGSLARYAVQHAWPQHPGGFPWATFAINVSGSLLIGVLMAVITRVWPTQRLLRPFLGVGILGGFTTFSAYALDIQQTVAASAGAVALIYLVATPLGALLAVWAGSTVTGWAVRGRPDGGIPGGGARR